MIILLYCWTTYECKTKYYYINGKLRLRDAKDLPPSSIRYDSPYDEGAHYGTKADLHWTGYKAHLTETCDNDMPHVIIHVETSIASKNDVEMTSPIHQSLDKKGCLPSEHLVDGGYISAGSLVSSKTDYQIELVGPMKSDKSWQAC